MKGTCTYRLSTNRINGLYIRKWLAGIVALLFLPVTAVAGWVAYTVAHAGIADDQLFDILAATCMGDMILTFLVFGLIRIRAAKASSPPAGETTLTWSPSGLTIRVGGEHLNVLWGETRVTTDSDNGVFLRLPHGRFTYMASKSVSPEHRESLVQASRAARQWANGMIEP